MKILALTKMQFLTYTVSVHIKLLITVHLCDTQIQIFVQDQVIIANLERVLSRKWKLNSVISLAHLYFWRPILTLSSAFIQKNFLFLDLAFYFLLLRLKYFVFIFGRQAFRYVYSAHFLSKAETKHASCVCCMVVVGLVQRKNKNNNNRPI